jgi:hypothetical protein
MAYEPSPGDSNRSSAAERDRRSAAQLDSELQPDPELAEGPASPAKMVIFVIGIAIVLGAVLYGLNHTTSEQGGTSSTAQKTQSAPAPAPSGNASQGTSTTGSAPAQPQQSPSSAPAGQDINRSGNPPNNAPNK